MDVLETEQDTLEAMRKKAGLTLEQAAVRLGEILGRAPYTHPRMIQIESGGTRDVDQINALCQMYGRSFPDVMAALNLLRN